MYIESVRDEPTFLVFEYTYTNPMTNKYSLVAIVVLLVLELVVTTPKSFLSQVSGILSSSAYG